MPDPAMPTLAVPWSLKLRRARYQIAPVATMLVCSALAAWLWTRHARMAGGTGEVSAVRVSLDSKVDGILEKLPQPVHIFDSVRDGQLVARVDLSLDEKQLQRLRAELERIRASGGGGGGSGATTRPAADPLVVEREMQIAELQARLDAREVKSPVDGTVMEIHKRPGEGARAGKTIMVIAAKDAPFIMGYLREDQPLRPVPGMKVTIRTRGGATPRRAFDTYVASVAPQVEPIPPRHLRNPNVPEWGMPVQIAIPPEAELRPGELVDLVFWPKD
jgi:multidrug resistance efflux pump